jgi:stage V sporulation protein K
LYNPIAQGNPGTGKTTIARLIARYLHAFGVLPRDRFVEKNGLEMKGQYVGHTVHTVSGISRVRMIALNLSISIFHPTLSLSRSIPKHKVKEAIADAMGGTLFLDEAYALADSGDDGFSGEAIRTLLIRRSRTIAATSS